MGANWHVRCVSVPGPDTDLALHVSFDNARFLIGCGEGTQRAFVQKRMSFRGLEAVFIPNASSRTRAGLPGVIMTAADNGRKELQIIGPPDIAHFVATFRSSLMRENFTTRITPHPIGISSDTAHEVFKSENLTVKAVGLVPPETPRMDQPTVTAEGLEEIDTATYQPDFSGTRPSLLPRRELEAWRKRVVSDMFGREARRTDSQSQTNRPGPSSSASGPFTARDGTFIASMSEHSYPLPLPTREEQETDMVYICQAADVRGKFDVATANALGVPNGPMRGRLVKGETIEVDDASAPGGKRLVQPGDCLKGGGPGAVLIVVTCSRSNLPSLLDSAAFHPYQSSRSGQETIKVAAVVHRVSRGLWRDERYMKWMETFGPTTQHLIADPEYYETEAFFRSAAWNTANLASIDSSIFRHSHGKRTDPLFEAITLPRNTTILQSNHQIKMQPAGPVELLPFHEKDRPPPNNAKNSDRLRVFKELWPPGFAEATSKAKSIVFSKMRELEELRGASSSTSCTATQGALEFSGADIEVTTLGTGSAIPSKYRNVSSTLLSIPNIDSSGESGAILLDCGEGTLGQLRRRFGPSETPQILKDLRMIFISHMHADHQLGLCQVLEERFKHGITSPLYIVGPNSIALHLQESASWQSHASDTALANVFFINSAALAKNQKYRDQYGDDSAYSPTPSTRGTSPTFNRVLTDPPLDWGQEDIFSGTRRWPHEDVIGWQSEVNVRLWRNLQGMLRYLNLSWIQAPLVYHRGLANGLVIKHASGWQLVYSGDTRPTPSLVNAGKGATLLIHEATIEDDKPEMAHMKGHSTLGQAIEVGRQMGAKHILLNHFSQRYPKVPRIPVVDPEKRNETDAVISISFDLMSIKIADMWKMAYYMEPISLLYADEEAEDEDDNPEKAVERDVNASIDEQDAVVPTTGIGGRQKGPLANKKVNGHAAPGGHGRIKPIAKRKLIKSSPPPRATKHVKSGAKHNHEKVDIRPAETIKGAFTDRKADSEAAKGTNNAAPPTPTPRGDDSVEFFTPIPEPQSDAQAELLSDADVAASEAMLSGETLETSPGTEAMVTNEVVGGASVNGKLQVEQAHGVDARVEETLYSAGYRPLNEASMREPDIRDPGLAVQRMRERFEKRREELEARD